MTSSGHLRRCSDADTSNKCFSREKDASILSWPTREIRYSARLALTAVLDRLIRSPTTLQRRRYVEQMLEP
eukprot:scaffold10269_cov163-Skeletonema_marinoi.AAC.2